MASLSDILTSSKNVVTAINNVAQTYLNVQGVKNSGNLTAATLVQSGQGRVATVVVTTAGSATGKIYDANSASATTNPIYVIPNTVGVVVLNMPVSFGIVVAPGTGQAVTISYSGA